MLTGGAGAPAAGRIRRRFWTGQQIGDARIISVHRIDELASGIVRPGEGFFDRRRLLRRQAGVILAALARQNIWIELAGPRVEHHSVLQSVVGVAGVQDSR